MNIYLLNSLRIGLLSLYITFGYIQTVQAYVIKSKGSGFSMNDIIELCLYGMGIGVVLVVIGNILKSKGIKDFGIQVIVLAISPVLLFIVFALFGYIVSLF